jgi:molybdenum cofactor cytidylyltransferase
MKSGALILAAGASTRLGSPKQLVRLGDETLLERSIRIAEEAGCAPVVVILGAHEELIRSQCNLSDVLVVFNPDWADGMGTSLSLGARIFENVSGIIVMTCDMPTVTADHLAALASSGTVTASLYVGRKGIPAYFPREVIPALFEMKGDVGAREILRTASAIELAGGEIDIDTKEDLARALSTFPFEDGQF